MDTLHVENDYSWLVTDEDDLLVKLWKALRFKDKNYNFNAAYKMKLWDGYKDFFDRNTGRFLSGLLPEVKAALKHWEVEYEIKDFRSKDAFVVEKVDEQFLGNGMILYDYQVDYINQAIKLKRGLVTAVTGGGKTAVMVGIVKALALGTPTLILCGQTEIVEQNYADLVKFGLPSVGRLHGTAKETDKTIMCVNWQSIHHIKARLPHFECIIVDEIHLMMSKKVREIYRRLHSAAVRIGLSATAFKFDGKDLVQKYNTKGFFGPPFTVQSIEGGRPTTKKLQERNILSEADFTFYRIKTPHLPYEVYQDAVTKGIAENNEFHDVVVQLASILKGRTIILVERIEQGDRLKERMPDAAWISGKDNRTTRSYVIDRLKNDTGNVVAIASSGIFSTGINVYLHNILNAAGGKADHTIIQRLGRGLRTAADKDMLHYFDFIFEMNPYLKRHSEKRIKILQKEGHVVNIKDEFDFGQVRFSSFAKPMTKPENP